MFNVGGGELLVIALIALIVLGPQRLPDAARQVGRVMGDLRRISSGFQQELKVAFDEDDDRPGPARRKEAVPLASTVADADKGRTAPAGERADADADTDGPVDADADPPAVAPAVAAALDEIVTPITGNEAGATGAADEPAPSGDDRDGLGDHRAAS
jgi:sec-independent protein translocase protein TatB